MQLTTRDIEILEFINEFGFCEMPQIMKRFGLTRARGYQIMKRLTNAELILHERIFHGGHGVFYLTRKGAECTDLPPIKNIPKDTYEHQLAIIEVYFKLREQYPEAEWIGERRIKREKFMGGIGKKGHLADGILLFPDHKEIAIEVELTMKSKKRLEDIIWGYFGHKYIKEVWYYCSNEVIEKVGKIAPKDLHVKIHRLS